MSAETGIYKTPLRRVLGVCVPALAAYLIACTARFSFGAGPEAALGIVLIAFLLLWSVAQLLDRRTGSPRLPLAEVNALYAEEELAQPLWRSALGRGTQFVLIVTGLFLLAVGPAQMLEPGNWQLLAALPVLGIVVGTIISSQQRQQIAQAAAGSRAGAAEGLTLLQRLTDLGQLYGSCAAGLAGGVLLAHVLPTAWGIVAVLAGFVCGNLLRLALARNRPSPFPRDGFSFRTGVTEGVLQWGVPMGMFGTAQTLIGPAHRHLVIVFGLMVAIYVISGAAFGTMMWMFVRMARSKRSML